MFDHIKLAEVVMPMDLDCTVNPYYDKLYFIENPATAVTATLAYGSYTATSFATQISNAMTLASTVGNIYTCTWNSTTNKYTIVATGAAVTFKMSSGPDSVHQDAGFYVDSTVFATSQTSDGQVDVGTPQMILINIREIGGGVLSTRPETFNFIVPVDVNAYERLTYSERTEFFQGMKIPKTQVQQFTIDVYDDSYRPLLLQKDWSMILKVW